MKQDQQHGNQPQAGLEGDFQRLRELLLGDEIRELLRLRDRLEDDEQFAERVAQVLAQAIARRSQTDNAIAAALAPTIDDALSGSVANDPERLANSIYPIMGPAIRKSIGEAINDLLEDFNRLLTMGLSWQSLGWRFEAWRSGRSYAEVALLKSLEYRVEQLFLIHRESGLLIHHLQADDLESRDPDMVSGMLSAIQSFIEDSFTGKDGQSLDTMRLGDLTVLVRQGPRATLAAVVRGTVPSSLRGELQLELERVHGRAGPALEHYDGDPGPLAHLRPGLEGLLQARLRDPARKTPWLALLVIMALLAAGGYWWYRADQHARALQAMADQLDAEPGIVWLSTSRDAQGDVLKLLVDPDARPPAEALGESVAGLTGYRFAPQAHVSADPAIVLRRARRVLAPPASVQLHWDGQGLAVSGRADDGWVRRAGQLWPAIPGVRALDTSGLEVRYPEREAIARLAADIENTRLEFDVASTELGAYTELIPELAVMIQQLDQLRRGQDMTPLRIDIVGYTDETGTRDINHRIGTQRAETVRAALLEAGVPGQLLNASDSLDYHNVSASRERQVRLFIQGG